MKDQSVFKGQVLAVLNGEGYFISDVTGDIGICKDRAESKEKMLDFLKKIFTWSNIRHNARKELLSTLDEWWEARDAKSKTSVS
jgi:hypothetical protein